METSSILRRAGKFLTDNSPALLTGLAVTGTIATAYLTGVATLKAYQEIQDEESLSGTAEDPRQRIKERLRIAAPTFAPAIATAAVTITCIVAANRISDRRAAALAVAYGLSERAYENYRAKVVEKVGEKKEKSYRTEAAQDHVTRTPVPEDMVLFGDSMSVLCCDLFTGRYFLSDMESLRRAENDINFQITHDMYASLTEFYDRIGLPKTSMSDDFGWNADKLLELDFDTVLTPSGKPCLTFNFHVLPIRGYARLQ